MDLATFADEVGTDGPVTISGHGTRGGAVAGVRCVSAPSGIDWVQADEMILSCGAGTAVGELDAALAAVGQQVALPPGGTVGGALAAGRSGVRRLGDGPVRNTLLQARYVSATGEVVKGGGPTVKNVSGFDICRLLVGSQGTLGFLGEVILRTRPRPAASQWFTAAAPDPWPLFGSLHRPTAVLWDGSTVWALLEGHPTDVSAQASTHGLTEVAGPPPLPSPRSSVAPSALAGLTGTFVAELGVGIVHGDTPPRPQDPGMVVLNRRVKHEFDPTGRLNPGRHP